MWLIIDLLWLSNLILLELVLVVLVNEAVIFFTLLCQNILCKIEKFLQNCFAQISLHYVHHTEKNNRWDLPEFGCYLPYCLLDFLHSEAAA